jgi:hypothetical protein
VAGDTTYGHELTVGVGSLAGLEREVPEVRCPANRESSGLNERGEVFLDQVAELRAGHDRDGEFDQVPTHNQVLEPAPRHRVPAAAD